MGILMSKLSESNMSFHGVIPGKKAESLGQIALDVVLGDSKNYHKEKLTFEVVDFQSAYHAILGRPAYARETPSMRLYLPRVEARLRGITALKAMSQVR